MRFEGANAGEAVLAADLVRLLLSLAHTAVLEVPHDPSYTGPISRPLQDDNSGCMYHFLSVDVENPNQVPLLAETRPVDATAGAFTGHRRRGLHWARNCGN